LACKRCGNCCKADTLLKDLNPEDLRSFKMMLLLKGIPFTNKPRCPFLDFKVGMAICKIYNDRPWFCKEHLCERAKNDIT